MKIKLKIYAEVVYEVDPEFYPEGQRTAKAMLAIDLANAIDDPLMLLEGADFSVTGEVIED